MSVFDPSERSTRGQAIRAEVTARDWPEPESVFAATWRDFVFAEVWNRPGLDRRTRFLIAMAGAACAWTSEAVLDGYVRGAYTSGALSMVELREAALHSAVYGGWGAGERLDAAVTRVAGECGVAPVPFVPLRAAPWTEEQRWRDGAAEFAHVMKMPGPAPDNPYHEGGILNFVFGEVWGRADLDQRSRRWLTLVGVCYAGVPTPIESHIHAAMASGNCTEAELLEFVLQFALHAGWPRASMLSRVITIQAGKVAAGLPFHG